MEAAKPLNDILAWRWTPCFGLIGGTLLTILLLVLVVPERLGSVPIAQQGDGWSSSAPTAISQQHPAFASTVNAATHSEFVENARSAPRAHRPATTTTPVYTPPPPPDPPPAPPPPPEVVAPAPEPAPPPPPPVETPAPPAQMTPTPEQMQQLQQAQQAAEQAPQVQTPQTGMPSEVPAQPAPTPPTDQPQPPQPPQ